MAIFSRLSSLRRKLLAPIGPGQSLAAPLRAHGKLDIDREFLSVGSGDSPIGRDFVSWVDEGFNRCERMFGKEPVRLRRHRLMFATDRGRVWVVACLWDSRDERSEQGHQRAYPFTLFVIVPAPEKGCPLASIGDVCAPLWTALEHHYADLVTASDRADFIGRVHRCSVSAPDWHRDLPDVWWESAKGLRLSDWAADWTEGASNSESLFMGLQRALLEHCNTKGRQPSGWRVPLSSKLDVLVQLGCWLSWLERNVNAPAQELGILLPMETLDNKLDMYAAFRPLLLDDFVCTTKNPQRVDLAIGKLLSDGGSLPEDHRGFLSLLRPKLMSDSATLADLATTSFPIPTSGGC